VSFDPSSPSDAANMHPDTLPGLNMSNPPKSVPCWIVTSEGEAVHVGYYHDASLWLKQDHWARQDGEPGDWRANDIEGWTLDREVAEAAAATLLETDQ